MKVVLLGNHSIYPFHQEAGVNPQTIRRVTPWNETLAAALAELPNLEVHFITLYKGRVTKTFQRGRLRVTYLVVPKLLNAATLFGWTIFRALGLVRRLQPELVHGIGTEHVWPRVALQSGKPGVITIHGVMNKINQRTQPHFFSRANYFALRERQVLRQAQQIIAISPYIEEILRELKSTAQIHPIENPVNARFFGPEARPAKSNKIVFVGHTGKGKGLLTLIAALGKLNQRGILKGWTVEILGPKIPGPHHEQVMASIAENCLQSQISFRGFQMPDAMEEIYRSSALLVLPSEQETAPMSIAEAMATGLSVIATRVGGISHMVRHGKTGFLTDVNDVAALEKYLEELISRPAIRAEMGEAGRAEADARWRPEKIAAQTVAAYSALLAGPPRPGVMS